MSWEVFLHLQFSGQDYVELVLCLPWMFGRIYLRNYVGLKFSLLEVFNYKLNFLKDMGLFRLAALKYILLIFVFQGISSFHLSWIYGHGVLITSLIITLMSVENPSFISVTFNLCFVFFLDQSGLGFISFIDSSRNQLLVSLIFFSF